MFTTVSGLPFSIINQISGSDNKPHAIELKDFSLIKVVGKGSFGKVLQVRKKDTGVIYAMKVLRKDHIYKRNQVEHTKTERSVLGRIKHPFIVGLNFAFQTADKLYFVLDYCAGGELFFHLGREGKFSEEKAKFYAAEITLALDHLHKLKVIYRDLKPENVLLDENGHIRLTDFGLSKEGIDSNSTGATSFCGTPEYLAPEILNRSGHGRAVDWWSLGALLYEMLTGLPPFYSQNRETLFDKIRKGALKFPSYVSCEAVSLLRGLLTHNPVDRLGSDVDDAERIKAHPFFASIDWDALLMGTVPPPWKPTISGSLDTSQFDKEFTNMPVYSPDIRGLSASGRARHGIGSSDVQFPGFTFEKERESSLPRGMLSRTDSGPFSLGGSRSFGPRSMSTSWTDGNSFNELADSVHKMSVEISSSYGMMSPPLLQHQQSSDKASMDMLCMESV